MCVFYQTHNCIIRKSNNIVIKFNQNRDGEGRRMLQRVPARSVFLLRADYGALEYFRIDYNFLCATRYHRDVSCVYCSQMKRS